MLTKLHARKIILHAAGLAKSAQFGKGAEAAYKVIDQLGFLQVDTNYVVERAHHHALAARVPDYKTEWLAELQSDGRNLRILDARFWVYANGRVPVFNTCAGCFRRPVYIRTTRRIIIDEKDP